MRKGGAHGQNPISRLMRGMMKVFSYVVDHDYGEEPNPNGWICTLCRCKFSKMLEKTNGVHGPRNLVELAEEGDWIIGTGGSNLSKSAGHGMLVYAMRVDITPTGSQCIADKRFKNRLSSKPLSSFQKEKQFALISAHFYYFGSKPFNNKPIDISGFGLEANPRGFHYVEPAVFNRFREWLEEKYQPGIHGEPRRQPDDGPKGSKPCKLSC
jgi:hypothetical protein